MPSAVFRADASTPLGVGHVMRCLALADALAAEGWRCAFASAAPTWETVPVLAAAAHLRTEVAADAGADALVAAWPEGCDILVVDHYGLDSAFEEAARGWAKGVVVIDDLANRRHACDLLVDTAPDRTEADYAVWVPTGCRLLLGPRYALVRPRFTALRRSALARRGTAQPVRRVLVSLGGTDPADVTSRALEGIARSGVKAEVDVVLGRVTPHLDHVRAAARRVPRATRVLSEVSDMAALMAKADLAVGAAGTTTWERCCLGLPTVLVTTARNQEHQAAALAAHGAALHLGWHEEVTAEEVAAAVTRLAADGAERRRLALAAADLCDGEGASRFVAAVSEVLAA